MWTIAGGIILAGVLIYFVIPWTLLLSIFLGSAIFGRRSKATTTTVQQGPTVDTPAKSAQITPAEPILNESLYSPGSAGPPILITVIVIALLFGVILNSVKDRDRTPNAQPITPSTPAPAAAHASSSPPPTTTVTPVNYSYWGLQLGISKNEARYLKGKPRSESRSSNEWNYVANLKSSYTDSKSPYSPEITVISRLAYVLTWDKKGLLSKIQCRQEKPDPPFSFDLLPNDLCWPVDSVWEVRRIPSSVKTGASETEIIQLLGEPNGPNGGIELRPDGWKILRYVREGNLLTLGLTRGQLVTITLSHVPGPILADQNKD